MVEAAEECKAKMFKLLPADTVMKHFKPHLQPLSRSNEFFVKLAVIKMLPNHTVVEFINQFKPFGAPENSHSPESGEQSQSRIGALLSHIRIRPR